MKLYIDISVLTLAAFVTGIQRAAQEIILRLIQNQMHGQVQNQAPRQIQEVILLYYRAADNRYYRIDNQAFIQYYAGHRGIKEKMMTKHGIALEDIGHGSIFFDLDAAWIGRVRRSYLLPLLKRQGAEIVVHIYDIISITHPQYCLQRGVYQFMDYLGAHLQYADKMIVNAHATVTELEKLTRQIGCKLPSCTVIPLGADFHEVRRIQKKEIRKSLLKAAENKPYLLMVGTIEPRKNHKLLLRAYDEGLRDLGYHIIFAGYMGWNMEVFEKKLKAHPDYGKRIFHFEGLKDDEISYLYQHAEFLVFCSYTEGYGLPLIEALQRGTPVLASDIPVSREVAGDYCEYFEQDNVQQICRKAAYFKTHRKAYHRLKKRIREYRPADWKSCYLNMRQVLCRG